MANGQLIPEKMRTQITLYKSLKKVIGDLAKEENRSLNSFMINAIITYIKDYHKEYYKNNKKDVK